MDCQLDIFFVEALLNGILLAGLLALGLNLIFGVIDVVWICYAELVMVGMYGINYAYKGGLPFLAAAVIGIAITAVGGALLHFLVIRPVLDTRPSTSCWYRRSAVHHARPAPPWRSDRLQDVGIRLGSVNVADMSFSWSRIWRSGGARRHGGVVALPQAHLFGHRHPRHRPGPPDHAVDGRRQPQALSRHVRHRGGLAGLAATLMVLQYDIYPQIGLQFGPHLHDLRAGRARQHDRRLVAAFIISQFIAVGASCFHTEWGYAVAFLSSWSRSSSGRRGCSGASHDRRSGRPAPSSASSRWRRWLAVDARRLPDAEKYYCTCSSDPSLVVHLYGLVAHGPVGLTSLGHGAFTGIGAYVTVMLWNFAGLTRGSAADRNRARGPRRRARRLPVLPVGRHQPATLSPC